MCALDLCALDYTLDYALVYTKAALWMTLGLSHLHAFVRQIHIKYLHIKIIISICMQKCIVCLCNMRKAVFPKFSGFSAEIQILWGQRAI